MIFERYFNMKPEEFTDQTVLDMLEEAGWIKSLKSYDDFINNSKLIVQRNTDEINVITIVCALKEKKTQRWQIFIIPVGYGHDESKVVKCFSSAPSNINTEIVKHALDMMSTLMTTSYNKLKIIETEIYNIPMENNNDVA
jgi:hypothetical protein